MQEWLCTRAQGEIRRSFNHGLENAGRHQGRRIHVGGDVFGNDIATLRLLNGYSTATIGFLGRRKDIPAPDGEERWSGVRGATHFNQPIKKRAQRSNLPFVSSIILHCFMSNQCRSVYALDSV